MMPSSPNAHASSWNVVFVNVFALIVAPFTPPTPAVYWSA